MNIRTGLFFFLTFCFIITPISGIIDHYCIMENEVKKIGLKLETIDPEIHLILFF